MDEGQDTAVRPLKKQNDTKYRNFVSTDCKLEYRIGRTAAQANSEAFSPDGSEEVSQRTPNLDLRVKKASCLPSPKNKTT